MTVKVEFKKLVAMMKKMEEMKISDFMDMGIFHFDLFLDILFFSFKNKFELSCTE